MSVQNIAETHTLTKDNRPDFSVVRDESILEKMESLYASEHYAALSSLI